MNAIWFGHMVNKSRHLTLHSPTAFPKFLSPPSLSPPPSLSLKKLILALDQRHFGFELEWSLRRFFSIVVAGLRSKRCHGERGSRIGSSGGNSRFLFLFLSISLCLRVFAWEKVDLSGDGVVRHARALGLHQRRPQLPEQRAGAPPRRQGAWKRPHALQEREG